MSGSAEGFRRWKTHIGRVGDGSCGRHDCGCVGGIQLEKLIVFGRKVLQTQVWLFVEEEERVVLRWVLGLL